MIEGVVGQSLRIYAYFINYWSGKTPVYLDITDATDLAIEYKDPAGNTGSLSATISDATKGKVYADLPSDTNTTPGEWLFMATGTLDSQTIMTFSKSIKMKAKFSSV